jgi:hypothetical protein
LEFFARDDFLVAFQQEPQHCEGLAGEFLPHAGFA